MKFFTNPVFLLLFLFVQAGAFAQTGSIKGKIQTEKGEYLAGITLVLENTPFGTITDGEGNFSFDGLPTARYVVRVTRVGLAAQSKEVYVASGKPTYIQFELRESTNSLNEVVIVGNRSSGYNAPTSAVSTRTPLALLETPQSIQVIPSQIILDQQALTVNDAMRNIAGVQNIAPGYSYYTFRGFDSYNNGPGVITNGIRGINYGFFQTASLFNVDKIEAIKGPAAALYSVGNPGGVININTKKPLSTNQYQFTTTWDNFGDYRFIGDATGPLDKEKKLLYRLIAGYNGGRTFRDHVRTNFLFLAPSLTYRISDKTSINAELNYIDDNTTIRGDRGIVALPRADGSFNFESVPVSWNRSSPQDKGSINSTLVQFSLKHRFNDRMSFTALHSYGKTSNDNESYSYDFGGQLNATTDSLVGRSWVNGPFGNNSFNLNYFLNYRFETGSVSHQAVVGADYGTASSYDRSVAYNAPPLSIANPLNTGNPATFPLSYRLDINNKTSLLGMYVQDAIAYRKIQLLVGLRLDHARGEDNTSFDITTTPKYTYTVGFTKLLPRLGIVYMPVKNVALYGSYTTSYNPTLGDPSFGSNAEAGYQPEGGVQYEAGIKSELFDTKLVATLALYHLTRTNILQNDPADPTFRRFVTIGEALSKGLELTLQGNISQAFNVTGFYAYNDVNITKDVNGTLIGNRLGNAPRHSANLWAKYNLLDGTLKGLGIGAGLDHASEKLGQFSNQDFVMPAYSNVDAMMSYGFRNYSLALNVYNLFNTRQIRGGYQSSVIFPGMPRTVRLSLNIKF